MKPLVLGIGNSILGDDGVGIRVGQELESQFNHVADFIFTEEMGFSLLDFLSGYEEAIIIDSLVSGHKEPGEIVVMDLANFDAQFDLSNHYVGLPEMARMAQEIGVDFPSQITMIGIEVEDPYIISDDLSPIIQKKFPDIVRDVSSKLDELLNQIPESYA